MKIARPCVWRFSWSSRERSSNRRFGVARPRAEACFEHGRVEKRRAKRGKRYPAEAADML